MLGVIERVAAGTRFMDERFPGWERSIRPGTFDMSDPCNCVIGQVVGNYNEARVHLELGDTQVFELGFYEPKGPDQGERYRTLGIHWLEASLSRLEPIDEGEVRLAA